MKKTLTTLTLAAAMMFSASIANAGIIIGDSATKPCEDVKEGIIIGDRTEGIIIGDRAEGMFFGVKLALEGIIIGDRSEKTCAPKEGIIIGDRTEGIIIGD